VAVTEVIVTRWRTDRSVHETAVRPSVPSASWAVRGYVGYEERPSAPMVRRELARNGVALILAFGSPIGVSDSPDRPARRYGAFVVGNQSRASLTHLSGHQHGVQVELTSAGARALVGAVGDLNDAVVPLDAALGAWGCRLVEHLGNAVSWEDRFCLLDMALASRRPDPVWPCDSPEVAWLKRQLITTGGQARVEPLMDETGWSRRVVTARFRSQVGVAPKAYARIVRFHRAVAVMQGVRRGRTVADIAIECGYYDQSHLARDFVALAGCTPKIYLAESEADPTVRFLQDEAEPGFLP
jgi:AraC-like DNA-binding protein